VGQPDVAGNVSNIWIINFRISDFMEHKGQGGFFAELVEQQRLDTAEKP